MGKHWSCFTDNNDVLIFSRPSLCGGVGSSLLKVEIIQILDNFPRLDQFYVFFLIAESRRSCKRGGSSLRDPLETTVL